VNAAELRARLVERLVEEAPSFDFFQAVRLLLRDSDAPALPGQGAQRSPVRFCANISFQWKASDVQWLRQVEGTGAVPTMAVNFLGLASPGVSGSLPHWYAVTVLAEAKSRTNPNPAMAEFFALFDDRLIQLYFRAWLRNNLPIQYELQRQGAVRRILLSLIGVGTPGVERLFPLDARALVHHAAALMRRPTTAAGLAASLAEWFGLPFEVQQFAESVQELAPEQRLRLGDETAMLGRTTVVGDFVRMRQGKFRLVAGPVCWRELVEFLPGDRAEQDGQRLRELMVWVRQAVGTEFDYDLQVLLREQEVPRLMFRHDDPQRTRLGMSMWLGERERIGAPAGDTLIDVSGLEQRRLVAARRAAVAAAAAPATRAAPRAGRA
jgi:type VI secretion system protein ImpH